MTAILNCMNNENQPTTPTANTTKAGKPFMKQVILLVLLVIMTIAAATGFVLHKNSARQASENQNRISTLESELETANTSLLEKESELADYKESTGQNDVKTDQFQSVFLKSGQVYFGKITKITESQITLENIYYIKENSTGNTNDISLIKLGNELHAPEDVMFIERKNVDFWENLKGDGQIAKAIKDYEATNTTE